MFQQLLKNPVAQRYILLFALLAISLTLFSPARKFHFVQLDDPKHITENPSISPPALIKLPDVWKEPYFGLYIPVTYSVWALTTIFTMDLTDGQVRFHPGTYHTLNLFIHLLNVLLLFLILERLVPPSPNKQELWGFDPSKLAAFMGTALFAVHPMQIETISWISCLKDLLATTFAFLSLWLLLRAHEERGIRWGGWYLLATWAFVFSFLSKPSTVILPAVFAGIFFLFLKTTIKRTLLYFVPWLLIAIPVVILTKSVQPSANIAYVPPIYLRPLIALDAIAFYFYKLLVPVNLSMDYGRIPSWVLKSGWAYVSWVLPVALFGLMWWKRKQQPLLLACFVLFVLSLSPVLGFVPFLFQIFSTVADRYIYFPIFILSILVSQILARQRKERYFAIGMIVFSVLTLLSARHLPRWKDGIHIFHQSIAVNPRSLVAHNNLGVEYQVRSRFREAAKYFEIALSLDPNRYDLYSNLGAALVAHGKVRVGINHLHHAELNGGNPSIIHYNLGRAYLRLGRYEKAKKYAALALEVDPKVPRVVELYQATQRLPKTASN